jgi:hypothetical protein
MNHHEREFFISLIRSGKIIIHHKDITLEVISPTIDQLLEANFIYNKAIETAYIDGLMTEEEVQEWMNNNGLWTIQEERKTQSLKDDLEKLKVEIYNHRYEKKEREQIRKYIRACEKYTAEHLKEKNSFYQNTRESYALLEKISSLIKNTTYHKNKLYDFKEISLSYVIEEWQSSVLSESNIRELAREEPWKSLWSIRENAGVKLFNNKDSQEITANQKHLIIWSQIYDNIQESLDCPEEEFIKDDDILDGWFYIQARKRKADKLERDLDGELKNEKIKNSKEVFLVTKDKDNQKRIEEMNDPIARAIKRQRQEVIMNKKSVNQMDLPDEKLELQLQINNMKNK